MSIFDIFVFAVNSVLPVILLVALGYFLKKTNLFTKEFLRVGNKTVFRLLIPALLFTNIAEINNFSELNVDALIYVLIAILIIIAAAFILSLSIKDKRQKGVILQCTFRSNFSLIGIPLAQLMAGDAGVRCAALISAFSIPIFNIVAVIALSIFIDSPDSTDASVSPNDRIKKIITNIVKNPLIISVLLGVLVILITPVINMLPASVLDLLSRFNFIKTVLDYLAKASTPVALLVLGGLFELNVIKDLKTQIIKGCLGRLIIAPSIGVGGAVLLQLLGVVNFDNSVYAVFVALFCTPVAVSSAVMAEEMNNDGQLASQLVVWTTLLSALIIFFIVVMLKALGLL
ncbi:MAG: AEC family transporter [Lachnospira sp.]